MTDVDKVDQNADSQQVTSYSSRGGKCNLMLGAPPGLSQIIASPGAISDLRELHKHFLLGEKVGIQLGIGTTAVTPTDFRMEQRISHGTRPPDGAPLVFESIPTGDNTDQEMYGNNWCAAYFVPSVSHRLTSVIG